VDYIILYVAIIVFLGIFAQWLSWRIHIPSILLLLLFGILAGPILGLIEPDKIFGELLTPIVSLSVAIILFEGSLSLRFSELKDGANVVRNLVSIGVLITWGIGTAGAYYILGLNIQLATLLGAILVVSGPTVVTPLLKYVRPSGVVGSIAKWEGIVIDPIGAVLAVIVFEVIFAGQFYETALHTIFKAVVFGGITGISGAGIIMILFRRNWVPDFLHNAVTLSILFGVYTFANMLQSESGLLTVTVMGIVLANQRTISVRHIAEFKENLTILLVSSVFIILASRLQMAQISELGWNSLLFLALLIFVARPLGVALSTWGSSLKWQERLFLAWLAPRGIVAAAVAAFFGIRLEQVGLIEADYMVALTFMVIVGTVGIYGLTLSPLAKWLKIATPNPQGVLILGSHAWARSIALTLQEEGFPVVMVDNDWYNTYEARLSGIKAYFTNILSDHALDEIDLGGIGRMIALTQNEEVNVLATIHFSQIFGRSEVYQLPVKMQSGKPKESVSTHLRGRLLFAKDVTYVDLAQKFLSGFIIKKTSLSKTFGYEDFKKMYGEDVLTLFIILESGNMVVCSADKPFNPQPGQILVSLVKPQMEQVKAS
jgi:NhaP-type Na+/H+ or K+/H+ antiporter